MAVHPVSLRRAVLLGGLATAICSPVLLGLGAQPTTSRVASCPANEVYDPISGACRPMTDQAPQTFDPINPENAPLEPGSITSSATGDVGQLPEVNGIPCNGDNTGLCIGLTEEDNQLEARPNNPNVFNSP